MLLSYYTQRKNLLGGTFNPNPKLYGSYVIRCILRKTLNPKKPLSYYAQRKN
jgi:hypothetical protein